MNTINISEFRAKLLKYLDIANSGNEIMITSNGKHLATIGPPSNQKELAREQLKSLAATAVIHNVTRPINVEWDALS